MMKFKFLSKNNGDPDLWIKGNGRAVAINELSYDHIHNIINCLKDRGSIRIPDIYEGYTKQEWIEIMDRELARRINERF